MLLSPSRFWGDFPDWDQPLHAWAQGCALLFPGNIHPFLHPLSSPPLELCPFYLEPCGQLLAVSRMFPDSTKEGIPAVSSVPTD